MKSTQPTVQRAKTAIRRHRCSRPIGLALADGVISTGTTVFDYGCGYGGDVRYLKSRGVAASGWDPHHRRTGRLEEADVVNLGFVLNVIEDPRERTEVLRCAYGLAQKVLIVAVRVDKALSNVTTTGEFGDGLLTAKNTFQKIYKQSELRDYVETVLDRKTHAASIGIVYVFKDPQIEAEYLAARALSHRSENRTELIAEFSADAIAQEYVALATKLGRIPLASEFSRYPKLEERFGTPRRIQRLLLSQITGDEFEASRIQRQEDIATFLSSLQLQAIKPPPFTRLPPDVQADIRTFWGSYRKALEAAREFLFSIGKPDVVADACQRSTVGKLVVSDLYVHESAEDELPPVLRLVIYAAHTVVGELDYDLVKIALDGRTLSFLRYEAFEKIAHPRLLYSVRVYLPKASYGVRSYVASENPPILHRKDTFVAKSHPHYEKYHRLTLAEERRGLLSRPDIGHRQAWLAVLQTEGLAIKGHKLVSSAS